MTTESDEEQPLLNPSSNQSLPDITYLRTAMLEHYADLLLTFVALTAIAAATTYCVADGKDVSVHPIIPVSFFMSTLLLLGVVLDDCARKNRSTLLENLLTKEELLPLRDKVDNQKVNLCLSGIIKGCFAMLSVLNKSVGFGLIAGPGLLLGAGGTYFWRVTKEEQEQIRQSLSGNNAVA